jgi:hypothetical protein
MAAVADDARGCRYVCVLAFLRSAHDPLPLIATGLWEGRLLREARGSGGFGYDPIFYVPEHDCSAAELAPATKNRSSHRARAMAALRCAFSTVHGSLKPARAVGLYVHLPWCVRKCPYCDFNSFEARGRWRRTPM